MSDQLPKAIASSTMRILGVDLTVHVLDNGERVIDAGDIERLFEAMGDSDTPLTEDEAVALAKSIRGMS